MPTANPIGLRQWIWRAFVRSALIPLVLVETALIAIYLLTNNAIRDAQIEYLRDTALNDLQAAVSLESRRSASSSARSARSLRSIATSRPRRCTAASRRHCRSWR